MAFTIDSVEGDFLLLKQVEQESKSEFIQSGGEQQATPVFQVARRGPDSMLVEGDKYVVLRPGHYDDIVIENERYTFAEDKDVAVILNKEED